MSDQNIHTCSYSCERPACIRAQRDELRAQLDWAVRENDRLLDEGRDSAAELASLRADAERYRWLRRLEGECDSAACVNFNIGFDWIEAHGVELDAAIDAACAQEPQA